MTPAARFAVVIVASAIAFVLLAFVGKFLWNAVLVPLVPGVQPVTSVLQIMGLKLLLLLLIPVSAGVCMRKIVA